MNEAQDTGVEALGSQRHVILAQVMLPADANPSYCGPPSGRYVGGGSDRIVGIEDRWVMTPAFTLLRVEGAGDTFTGVSRGRYPDGTDWIIVTIGEIRHERVWRGRCRRAEAD